MNFAVLSLVSMLNRSKSVSDLSFCSRRKISTSTPCLLKDTFEPSKQGDKKDPYNDFIEQVRKVYGNKPLEDVVNEAVSDEDNFICEGTKKRVYCIPGIDNYLAAVYKKITPDENAKFLKSKNDFPDYNAGQPIATNRHNIIIMERVNGEAFSIIPNVAPLCRRYEGTEVSHDEALVHLNAITSVCDFPLDAYIKLAKEIKYFSNRGIRLDFMNCNNLLADNEKQEFAYVDLPEKEELGKYKNTNIKNGTVDMICLFLNPLLFGSFLKVLNEDEVKILLEKSEIIIDKCKIAGEIAGLEYDTENTRKAFEIVAKSKPDPEHKRKHVEWYQEMLDSFDSLPE